MRHTEFQPHSGRHPVLVSTVLFVSSVFPLHTIWMGSARAMGLNARLTMPTKTAISREVIKLLHTHAERCYPLTEDSRNMWDCVIALGKIGQALIGGSTTW
jgi:hypothetical protein